MLVIDVFVCAGVVISADVCLSLCPGEGALCSIPIENILAVERLEEESFKMKNVREMASDSLLMHFIDINNMIMLSRSLQQCISILCA